MPLKLCACGHDYGTHDNADAYHTAGCAAPDCACEASQASLKG